MKKIRLVLLGFGTVGVGLVKMLLEKKKYLTQNNLSLSLVGIAKKNKNDFDIFYNSQGLPLEELIAKKKSPWTQEDWGTKKKTIEELLNELEFDILVECTPTNLTNGEPALGYLKTTLSRGRSVVTSNKGPIALAFSELSKLAKKNQAQIKFESTVLSGTPVFNLIEKNLISSQIKKITAILNGTTNYILGEMAKGLEYEKALQQAQNLGYAETNPDADILGYDSLAKTIILGNVVMGNKNNHDPLTPHNVPFMGIDKLKLSDVLKTQKDNYCYKLIGIVEKKKGLVSGQVVLKKLSLNSPLASIQNNQNALLIENSDLEEIMIVGPGAGEKPTAFGLFYDILAIV